MRRLDIRDRVLLAALLPVLAVVPLLASGFILFEMNVMETAHRQRAQALARQLAAAAEFPLFVGNAAALQGLADAAMREPEVKSVVVVSQQAGLLAASGTRTNDGLPASALNQIGNELVSDDSRLVVLPVVSAQIPLGSTLEGEGDVPGEVLGYVGLELARDSFAQRERDLVLAGLLATLAGLVFGSVIAVLLSRGVARPIVALLRMVERFGGGELSARVASASSSPLRKLEEGINRMAERIERGHEELERRVAEATAELRVQKEEAERATGAKSRFLAAASHDLRQPIHALRLFVESLREEIGDQPKAGALLERIHSTVESTAEMFSALLDISKLEAGVMEKHIESIPAQLLLDRLETMFSPIAVERGLRFSVVGSTAWISTDAALADRILQNLVSNALKYTESGGVVVGCRRRASCLSLEVWDTGPGIPPEKQREIFYEFVQLTHSAGGRAPGLGLGLAIVERISRLLEQPVRLRSAPGRGTMFAFEVPYGAPRTVPPRPIAEPQAGRRFDGVRVAVLDDEESITAAMRELLERWGCSVITARSKAQLLDQLAERSAAIDLLVCDYRLGPSETGVQVIAALHQALGRRVPAILITGDTDPRRLKEAHRKGIPLLHKPVAPEQLRERMHALLDGEQVSP